ncbi:hypothetical protein [Mesorhizobium sp.]|nr:hypothetical protein [Mesorhizobium sp.]
MMEEIVEEMKIAIDSNEVHAGIAISQGFQDVIDPVSDALLYQPG